MSKSEVRRLRKELEEAQRKQEQYAKRAVGVSAFIRDHMLKAAALEGARVHAIAETLRRAR